MPSIDLTYQISVIAERLYEAALHIPARRSLARLQPQTPECESIRTALLNTLNGVTTAQEESWIRLIEARRDELNDSKEEVVIKDYGAGEPHFRRTEQEMSRGTQIRKVLGHVSRRWSKSPFWSFMLFRLVREMKPRTCLELGTALGISGCYHAAALKLNGIGRLVTLEGADAFADVAERGFKSLKLDNTLVVPGRFRDTLSGVLHQHAPIDYVFIDGHHDGAATWEYFVQIAEAGAETTILVFDDISWSRGMKQAWQQITTDKRVRISFNLGGIGICVLSRHIDTRQHIHVRIG